MAKTTAEQRYKLEAEERALDIRTARLLIAERRCMIHEYRLMKDQTLAALHKGKALLARSRPRHLKAGIAPGSFETAG
jgi:hypothetical protein